MKASLAAPPRSSAASAASSPSARQAASTATGVGTRVVAGVVTLMMIHGWIYFRYVTRLGLYSDDWSHLSQVIRLPLGTLARMWPSDYRPFDMLPWVLDYHLWGHAIGWYYGTMFAVNCATAIVLYALVWRVTRSATLALAAAALWSVYPADSSVFWLTTIAYRTGALFFLLTVAFVYAARSTRWPTACYGGALVCCALCLASNELYLGLVLAVPVLVAPLHRDRRAVSVLPRAAPFALLIAAYAGYRFWLGPRVLQLPDNKGAQVAIAPLHALGALAQGVIVVLPEAWHDAAARLIALLFGAAHSPPLRATTTAVLALGALSVGLAGLVWLMGARRPRSDWGVRYAALRPGATALGVGGLGIIGGYAALALTADPPSIDVISSRVNAAASLGAAVFVAGAVWTLAHWLPVPRAAARLVFVAGIIVLWAMAAVRTERVATSYTAAWTTQQHAWRRLLAVAPSLRPHTLVVVMVSDLPGWDVLTALPPWAVDDALPLLYPGSDVRGDSVPWWEVTHACAGPLAHRDEPVWSRLALSPAGITTHLGAFVPWRRVLALRYTTVPDGQFDVIRGDPLLAGPGCRLHSNPRRIGHAPVPAVPWRALAHG